MNTIDAQKRIKVLVETLKEASAAYYQANSSGKVLMSDSEFDSLRDELAILDPENDFLATVGAPLDNTLAKVKHEIPMGSLHKMNVLTEFETWLNSVSKTSGSDPLLAVNWKLDGSSIELIYKYGVLTQAITRGDGKIGEDVTANIKNANGFPKKLSEPLNVSVRVEVLFRNSDWDNFLKKEADTEDPEHVHNSRNVAAGTVRRTDGRNSNHLYCVAFNVVGDAEYKTYKEKLSWLRDEGFEVPETYFIHKNKFQDLTSQVLDNRPNIKYRIDGLVATIDDCSHQEILGEKDGKPYWARAWKFPSLGASSVLLSVSWAVGTRGTINPVGHIEPTEIDSVIIRKSSLHNIDYINKRDLQIGDKIWVERANDVIPQVCRVIEKGKNRKKIVCTECPSCGGSVHLDGKFMRCSKAEDCEGVLNKRIMKYIKKREIMFLGESALDKLIESGSVNSVRDLYFLTVDKMTKSGLGEAMSMKILAEIQKSMTVTLSELIGSLSIDLLGRSEAQNIVDGGFTTIGMWRDIKASDLLKLGGYQDQKANRICNSLKTNWDIVEELKDILQVEEGSIKPKVHTTGVLNGASFCFTGKASMSKKELHSLVKKYGGKAEEDVDSNLNYLVTADPNSDSGKVKKAKKLASNGNGIKIITEEDLNKMIGM